MCIDRLVVVLLMLLSLLDLESVQLLQNVVQQPPVIIIIYRQQIEMLFGVISYTTKTV